VVALDDGANEIADDLHALVRVGVVTDDITEADVVRRTVRFRIRENGLQRFEIGVDISKNSESH
jgi:hypothetical protein